MDLMTACRFGAVFLGIETPDPEKLAGARKLQNTRDPLGESVDRITQSGLRIMAGFIVGFDGETTIKRSDFGINYGLPMLGDEVTLNLEAEFKLNETANEFEATISFDLMSAANAR